MRSDDLILVADDEPLSREFLTEVLTGLGAQVVAVADGEAATLALAERPFDSVWTDLKMPKRNGLDVLAAAKRDDPDRPVVLITAHGTLSVAVEALRAGADDILEKPVSPEDLAVALHRVRERRRLLRENRRLQAESVGDELLAVSPPMRDVVELAERVARSSATVLIQGESGTGKERIAALLHRRSDRAERPFVKINCAAIPEALIESEFFGHEPGAFTGATTRRAGRFELADGGTLFLDEVGEMPLALQAKLLRVLQDGEVTRVGGSRAVKVDVRIVAATNRDLAGAVHEARFRQDLYWRLNVVPIHLPPLRDRPEDVLPLARRFLAGRAELTPAAERALEAHDWPGNVRELENIVQRACLLCRSGVIDAPLLAPWIMTPKAQGNGGAAALVGRPLRAVEREVIDATLAHCRGNRTRAAEMLGISVRTLFNRLQERVGH